VIISGVGMGAPNIQKLANLAVQEWHYALIQAKFDVEETRVHHMSTVSCKISRRFGMYSYPAGLATRRRYDF